MARHASDPQHPTVGFDLDMTLIDSRPGIQRDVRGAVGRDRHVHRRRSDDHASRAAAGAGVGALVPRRADPAGRRRSTASCTPRTRSSPPSPCRAPARPWRRCGPRAAGPSSSPPSTSPNAKLHLEHLGIEPDAVVGWLWAEAKAEALREFGAGVYVGDHVGDVRGARTAAALSVAVPTGPCARPNCGRRRRRGAAGRPARLPRAGWRSGPGRPVREVARRSTAAGSARTAPRAAGRRPSAPGRRRPVSEAHGHQHAHEVGGGREGFGAEEERRHGDQRGECADEEDDAAGSYEKITGAGRFSVHVARVDRWATVRRNRSGRPSPVTGHRGISLGGERVIGPARVLFGADSGRDH